MPHEICARCGKMQYALIGKLCDDCYKEIDAVLTPRGLKALEDSIGIKNLWDHLMESTDAERET